MFILKIQHISIINLGHIMNNPTKIITIPCLSRVLKTAASLIGVSCLLMLGGCATLSEEECITADWYQLGVEDGSAGRSLGYLANHRKACAKAGVTPSLVDYEKGHSIGAKRYCVYSNGLALGERGGAYNNLCVGKLEEAFGNGYHLGKARYEQRKMIERVESTLMGYQDELEKVYEDIALTEEIIISDESTPEERREALVEIEQMKDSIPLLEDEIDITYQELDEHKSRLKRLMK